MKGCFGKLSIGSRFWQDLFLPFTLAHPAAVLPFRRTRLLVFSALIVGSLAPDLPYFLIFSEKIRTGHTVRGLFLLCLPIGLAVLWLWHAVVKRPMASLAPEFVRRRISAEDLQFRFWPISRFVVIVASLLLGSFLHIVWDGFTHDNGFFVKHWTFLSQPVMLWRAMPLWKALQFGCSVAGIAAVALVMTMWWWKKPRVAKPVVSEMKPRLRLLINGIVFLFAGMVSVAIGFHARHGHSWKWCVVNSVVAAVSVCGAELLAFSAIWHWSRLGGRPEHLLNVERGSQL